MKNNLIALLLVILMIIIYYKCFIKSNDLITILKADNYILQIEVIKYKTEVCDLENSSRRIIDQDISERDQLIKKWDHKRMEYKTFYSRNKKVLSDKKYNIWKWNK